MSLRNYINENIHSIILFLFVVCIVLFKFPHLGLPFFWDEAWVYAPAIKLMGQGMPSLMPDAIPVNFTRGHPLLFHFIATLWLKIFGNSNTSLHSFALTISILLLVSIYYFGKSIFNKDIALAATILFAVQAVFLAQSSFLLPEVLLSLFTILTLFFFLKKQKLAYVISASALLMTKESGLILIASLCIWFILDTFYVRSEKKRKLYLFVDFLIILAPLFIASIYFFAQWEIYGWVFYPEHIGMIDLSYNSFLSNYRKVYNFFFEEQGRKFILMGFLIAFLILFKNISFKIRVFIVFAMLTCVKIFFGAWRLPPVFTLIITGILLILVFYFSCLKPYIENENLSHKAICIFFIFCLSFLLFSSVNFFSKRYLLCAFPFFFLAITYFVYYSTIEWRWLYISIGCVAIMFAGFNASDTTGSGDHNLSYIKVIYLQGKLISFMEQNDLYEKNIHATFLNSYEMTSEFSDFLSGNRRFTNVSDEFNESTEYAIITNYQVDKWFDIIPKSSEFKVIKHFENDNFWVEIYLRK